MTRQITLNAVQAGMTRLRDKGGASENSLYELTNGYVTAARTIESRPGCDLWRTLPPETKGLAVFLGELTTFSHIPVVVPAGIRLEIIRHPGNGDLALRNIHFAAPVMGFLYVVAEFNNGDVFHYWLETLDTWSAGQVVVEGTTLGPVSANGYIYEATRVGERGQVWKPGVARAVSDVVEPTIANGYRFTVAEVFGARPASGNAEPNWQATNGARTIESTDAPPPDTEQQPVEPQPANPQDAIRALIRQRYPGFGSSIEP